MADRSRQARVVALDRLWPGDAASRSGDLLNVVFGWGDLTRLRRVVADRCTAAGLTGSRQEDFILAVHEIAANAIMHGGSWGRLILRRTPNGLRCLIADRALQAGDPAPARVPDAGTAPAPDDAESGRGLWLAAQLVDELGITSGPGTTIVSLYMRFD